MLGAALVAVPPSAHAATQTFENSYEIATFCAGSDLVAMPSPDKASSFGALDVSALSAFSRHWLERAITAGRALGKDTAAAFDAVNRQGTDIGENLKAGHAPFYDLTVCEAPGAKLLWQIVPATIDTARPYTPRNGPVSLDRLADDREVDLFHSLTGRMRSQFADLPVREAFQSEVRILALAYAASDADGASDRQKTGKLRLRLAEALQDRRLGDPGLNTERALAAYQAATTFLDSSTADWGRAEAGACFAYFTRNSGDRADNLERAIAACQLALPVLNQPETRQSWANVQLVLAGALHDRMRGVRAQNIENAIAADRAALSVRSREEDPAAWATTQVNLGTHLADRRMGDEQENIEAAIAAYEAACTILTRERSAQAWAVLQTNLAPLYATREKGGRSANQARTISLLTTVLGLPAATDFLRSGANYQLGEIYSHRLDGERRANLERAVSYFREALLGAPLTQRWAITTGRALGNVLIALGRYEEARDALLIASRAAERLIGLGLDEAQLRDVLSDTGDVYVLSAYAAAKLGDNRQALMILSAGKARLLFTALAANKLDLSPAEMAEIRRLRAELQGQDAALENLVRNDPSGRSTDPIALNAMASIRQRIMVLYDKGSQAAFAQPKPEQAVVDGALVAPVVTEAGAVILVALPGGIVRSYAVPDLTSDRIDQMARGASKSLRSGADLDQFDSGLQSLQTEMGATLGVGLRRALTDAGIAPGSILRILPDGADALLPVSLASSSENRHPLLEDYEISFVPSLAALAASHRRIAQADSKSLALVTAAAGEQLDYAPIEGLLVQAGFGSAPHDTWPGVTKAVLLQNLGSRTYWHFATHGTFDWDNPRQSGVVVDSDNAMLTLADLLDSRATIGSPRLVVLSACSTGLSDVKHNPDEFTGLPTGFLFAGAAGVVASLWPVNDLSTTLLMSKFYDLHLGLHQRPAQALRGAQLWLRSATVADLQSYAQAKRASGLISVEQLGLLTDDLSYLGQSAGTAARPFASPRFWGAFVIYGE